jgi:glucose/mannose-6-phosphate isomerase
VSHALEPPFACDSRGMTARITGIPAMIAEGLAHLEGSPWALPAGPAPELLAVGAMGGSAIAAELTAGLYADRLPRPLVVVREERWPAFVTGRALALVCSYSGETAESLALYREAGERQVARAALATGGTLAAWARRDTVPLMTLPGGSPPRAALFAAWTRLTALIGALGWCDDPAPAWREAAAVLEGQLERLGPQVPEARNPAKRLARALHGRLPFVYSRSGAPAAVGVRWRQQLNENAKVLAHSAVVPELGHNEIVGWETAGTVQRQVSIVVLRDRDDPPQDRTRLALTAEVAAGRGAEVHEIESEGDGPLARMASLVLWGDLVSLYLAVAAGVDPTPIASIDEFKRRLAGDPGRPPAR